MSHERRELPPLDAMTLEELRAEVEGNREAFATVTEELIALRTAHRALRGTIDALMRIRDERDDEIERLRNQLRAVGDAAFRVARGQEICP